MILDELSKAGISKHIEKCKFNIFINCIFAICREIKKYQKKMHDKKMKITPAKVLVPDLKNFF
jgi:hypothetical protein